MILEVPTFLLEREGFLELDKQHLLFIWRPIPTNDTYVVAEDYLIENESVFPIKRLADIRPYEGMSYKTFESKVKAVIAKNINAN